MLTPKHILPNDGARLFAPGGDISTTKLAAADTGNALSFSEYTIVPGAGPPLHRHAREDETFYILEGTVAFHIGGQRIDAAAGSTLFAPRGVPHTFKNCTQRPARMILIVTPPDNFEAFYRIVGAPGPGGQAPSDDEMIGRIMRAAGQYGIEILGPSPL